jgi:tRNA A-37 threonylcarbamoyl transferase component Bud32
MAYERLKPKVIYARGVISDFYRTITKINPVEWPTLHMFLSDKLALNAVLTEYIPNMKMIDLSNNSTRRLSKLRDILLEMHEANVLQGDAYPMNMIVVPGESDRVLWVDFGRAQTIPEDPLTQRREEWLQDEVKLVEYFVNSLVRS